MLFCLFALAGIVLVAGHFAITNTFSSDISNLTMPSQPNIWDVLLFNGSILFGLLTGTITGAPFWITLIMWVLLTTFLFALIFLIRGVS